ncbi:ankyrin repeat-containing protein [Tanacetum coccineum]|uniref:Ankyrin repeat-containing protein n=1 Tax=Tanacetum coccineum TaxID=301880 RepID=A0ABQ5J1A0_9ASTR
MLIRFQSSQAGSLHEQFFSISQNRTARDYVTTFEKMAAQLSGLHEEVQKGIFIKGPKPDLRVAVRTQKPVGGPFKCMTDSEFADKRAKGLCYRCYGKFGPGHRCSVKALQVLLADDEEEEKEGGMTKNTLHLEDKVVFHGGGDDMNRWGQVYKRKIRGG